jgi:predicted membrane-bound spermidine synthase
LLTIAAPLIARPVVPFVARLAGTSSWALFLGSFLSVLVIFSPSIILLAFTSPFALRLLLDNPDHAGSTSGKIYALSTFGSIVGAFLAVFVLIPGLGAIRTFLSLGTGLMLIVFMGLLWEDRRRLISMIWMLPLAAAGWYLGTAVL